MASNDEYVIMYGHPFNKKALHKVQQAAKQDVSLGVAFMLRRTVYIALAALYTHYVTWSATVTVLHVVYHALAFALACHITSYVMARCGDVWGMWRLSVRRSPLVWMALAALALGVVANRYTIVQIEEDLGRVWERLRDHEQRLRIVEAGLGEVKRRVDDLDAAVNVLTRKTDELYTASMTQYKWITDADTWARELMYGIFSKLSSKTITRKEFGLGCFEGGTPIHVDEAGATVRVETLRRGDLVWSPALRQKVPVKLAVAGPEDGTMYAIATEDGRAVLVTGAHPMKLCAAAATCQQSTAARDVAVGDLVQTVAGPRAVASVVPLPANGRMVYNVQLDLPADVPVWRRDVVANGVLTLDLEAQKAHETPQDGAAL